MIGTIKKLEKKHGFLRCEGHDEVYFKKEWLEDLRWENLKEGQTVEFDLAMEGESPQARRLRRSRTGPAATPTPGGTGGMPVAAPARPAVARGRPGRFLNPYNFVRFLPRPDLERVKTVSPWLLWRCPPPPHDRHVGLTGSITCAVEAVTPLFVSDSEEIRGSEKGHRSFRFFQYDGERALPAASLRGAVRGVFEAVTNSCLAVFGGEVQSRHLDPGQAPWLVPARVERDPHGQWQLRLLTGTEQLVIGATPAGRQYAAWLHRYWPMRPSRTLTRSPEDEPPVHGRNREILLAFQQRTEQGEEVALDGLEHAAECYALLQDTQHPHPRIKVWDVLRLSRDRSDLPSRPGNRQRIEKGWLCLTNQNIEPKHSERFFFREGSQRGHPETIDLPEPVRRTYEELIRDYQQRHEKDVLRRRERGLLPGSPAGENAALSRFVYNPTERELRGGELVYAMLDGTPKHPAIRFIAPVSVPRVTYEHSIADVLRAHHPHLERCTEYDGLCPACRTFGWVRDAEPPDRSVRVACAGRLRFSHGRHTRSVGQPIEVPLAILSSPKPTTALFYLARSDGRPFANPKGGYDNDVSLRGRKIYRHHAMASEAVYRRERDERDDQNRTARDVLPPGNTFEFTIDFENLAAVELGALLWCLELDGWGHHRLGFARPLGLGSVLMRVQKVEVLQPDQRYRSLLQTGLQECQRQQWQAWVEEFKQALATLYGQASFEGLLNVCDLRALLEAPSTGLPIHYPRDPTGGGQGENFRWFMANRHPLPLPTEETDGLPLQP